MTNKIRNIALLGSTGSIGTQTLEVVSRHPDRFRVTVLVAGSRIDLLADQASRLHPALVVTGYPEHEQKLRSLLEGTDIEVASGPEAIIKASEREDVDIVVTAMVGFAGLAPTLAAISRDKVIALANKETLVAGGELIMRSLEKSRARIIPVDSEHSAIFQCLQGESATEASKIILTASGGPFRKLSVEQLEHVSVEDALNHPNWQMGAKVTIDSASMMNKGFEMIEARWLFGCPPHKIQVVVHPQSIVHSMVQFRDGSIKAQLGLPDMRLPISYALSYPERLEAPEPQAQLPDYANLTFEAPDMAKFPLLRMAFEAIEAGGTTPCLLNAANEIAVQAFLEHRLRFVDMPHLVQATLQSVPSTEYTTLEELVEADNHARLVARKLINTFVEH